VRYKKCTANKRVCCVPQNKRRAKYFLLCVKTLPCALFKTHRKDVHAQQKVSFPVVNGSLMGSITKTVASVFQDNEIVTLSGRIQHLSLALCCDQMRHENYVALRCIGCTHYTLTCISHTAKLTALSHQNSVTMYPQNNSTMQ
jgi:hypothetical protein